MSDLGNFAKKLRRLETNMNRRNGIAKSLADDFADKLRDNLPQLGDNYAKGAGNDLGYVSSTAAKQTATITWTGNQIFYIEFGTGSPAVGRYQNTPQMMDAGYAPRATGHSLGVYWTLPMDEFSTSDGKPIVTKGWEPYAPFLTTQLAYHGGQFHGGMIDATKKQVESLL